MNLLREEKISLAEKLASSINLAELQYAKLLYESLARDSGEEDKRKYYADIARRIETDLSGR